MIKKKFFIRKNDNISRMISGEKLKPNKKIDQIIRNMSKAKYSAWKPSGLVVNQARSTAAPPTGRKRLTREYITPSSCDYIIFVLTRPCLSRK